MTNWFDSDDIMWRWRMDDCFPAPCVFGGNEENARVRTGKLEEWR